MKTKYLLVIIFLFISAICISQQKVTVDKKEFYKLKIGYKEALMSIKEGDALYIKGGEFYKEALPHYLKAQKYNDINPELNYKIGVCYYGISNYNEAYIQLRKAFEFKDKVSTDINLLLGRCLHRQAKYNEAIEFYKKQISFYSPKEAKKSVPLIEKYIKECENGMAIKKSLENIYVENMGESINSEYPDYYPVLSRDESKLYITSRRPVGTKKEEVNRYDNMYFENIYVAYNINNEWKKLKIMDKPINTEENNVLVGTSYNDDILYLYKGKSNGGDIYEATQSKGKWKSPKTISAPINTKYMESSLCASSDGKMIFFVSDKKDKEASGGKDIYVVVKKDQKKWDKPLNIGKTINTPYDEEGVYITKDGSTLYFSSQGHNSIGGFDIFKTVMDANGNWSKPENMGYPINTPGDDLFFTITDEGRYAYYSSDGQDDRIGDIDIFQVIFMGPDKKYLSSRETDNIASLIKPLKNKLTVKEEITTNVTILKGYIKDDKTLLPIYANIDIVDNEVNESIFSSHSDSITGSYFVTLPAGKSYGISVNAEGYLFQSEYLDIPISAKYEEIIKDIELKAIEVGSKLVLKNVFFETNSAKLQEESFVELGFVIKVLNENPKIRIEISGHTDNVGSYDSNVRLSKERAKSVVNFLIEQGIESGRLEYKGLGYTEPIASNDTEEGRQQNRRVEFKIVGSENSE